MQKGLKAWRTQISFTLLRNYVGYPYVVIL
jgi:hypothetical protein